MAKGCRSCKKGKEVTELQELIEIPQDDLPISLEEIKEAYIMMTGLGITPEQHAKINRVYKYIFNEDLPYGCKSCGSTHFRKFTYHIKEVLKLKV